MIGQLAPSEVLGMRENPSLVCWRCARPRSQTQLCALVSSAFVELSFRHQVVQPETGTPIGKGSNLRTPRATIQQASQALPLRSKGI